MEVAGAGTARTPWRRLLSAMLFTLVAGALLIGGLAIGRVSFDRWVVFVWPLLLILVVFISAGISLAAIL